MAIENTKKVIFTVNSIVGCIVFLQYYSTVQLIIPTNIYIYDIQGRAMHHNTQFMLNNLRSTYSFSKQKSLSKLSLFSHLLIGKEERIMRIMGARTSSQVVLLIMANHKRWMASNRGRQEMPSVCQSVHSFPSHIRKYIKYD